MDISHLELTHRAENVLRQAGMNTVEQIIDTPWVNILSGQNCGAKTIADIGTCMMRLHRGELRLEAKRHSDAMIGADWVRSRLAHGDKCEKRMRLAIKILQGKDGAE